MNKKIVLFISLFLVTVSFLQAQIAMGNWRTHFAYNNINQVTQSPNKIFAVSDGSLFSIDKRDGNIEFYSKLSGLNGNSISKIEYDDANETLVIVYINGNIDFLSTDGVKNLPDYYNKQMNADKGVNHIQFHNNKIYFSCNFGIVTINTLKNEIQDTYYIGANASEVKVLNTTIQGNKIFATTSTDIYTASLSDPFLISYERWTKLTGLPGSGSYQSLVSFGDNLILMRGGKMYKKGTDNVWTNLDVSTTYTNIILSGNYLQALTASTTYIFDKQLNKTAISSITTIADGVYDATSDLFWFAVGAQGVAQYKVNGGSPIISYFKPDGPAVNLPWRMRFSGQKLFVVQGGRWGSPNSWPGLVMTYENNVWKNILNSSITTKTGKQALDFMDVAVDPADNKHFFATSFGTGLYEFKNDEFYKWYTFDNSPIESSYPGNYLYMRMEGCKYDDLGNVWFINSSAGYNRFKVLKPDGTWYGINHPDMNNKPTFLDPYISNVNKNQKWFLSLRISPGVGIIDDKGTLDNNNDDQTVFYSSFPDKDKGGVIAPEYYFSMAQDKNGVMWVGTDKGPLLFNNPSKAFDSDFTCSRVKIPRNDGTDLADYLLVGERIKSIAIDGANRKWLGTEASGVYLLSENGQETIQHFTAENSPLLSNHVISIAINPITGEVFFGTGNGIVSYQSDAAEGSNVFENVHAYPNPVRENHTGIITITGLVAETNVKITDLAGNLVCQTISNGSIATWDGKNTHGQKVSTGVYLVLCIAPDGTQSTTTKILVIN